MSKKNQKNAPLYEGGNQDHNTELKMKYSSNFRQKQAYNELSTLKADLDNLFQKEERLNTKLII